VPLTCDWADVIDEDDNNSKQIFLSGLNDNINEETLKEIFAEYGRIENVILSREHKNSKRKDLAFITYNTHEEAKHANEDFKLRQDNKDSSIDVLGERIGISLAFSQQAMQNKKKIKESRRKPTVVVPGQIPIMVNKSATSNLSLDPRQQNSGNANISGLSNMFSNITANLPQNMLNANTGQSVDLTSINPSNTNATALLTMMNLLNMNKVT
jgi:RNA recognition motif-containing protein